MGKIITYKNAGPKGMFCQIKLESGERILISIAQSGVKIFKLRFMGMIPVKTLWELNDIVHMVEMFADPANPEKPPLDAIRDKLINCKSIKEVLDKINL